MDIEKLIGFLEGFVTEERKELFQKIADYRTNYVTVVLEDIYQAQNASAVLRTCDCFGVQNVHVIENNNTYHISPDVTLGSDKWLNIHKHKNKGNNTLPTLKKLKDSGYRLVATTPHTNDVELEDFDLSKGKVALLFGTELTGLSEEALGASDEFLKIPMFGFTESFNISVSASIVLHHLTYRLRQSEIQWQLTPNERNAVLLEWLKTSIKDADSIIGRYVSDNAFCQGK